jgi:hypothetical protein
LAANPSPQRRPFRPARRQGRCVGHSKVRPGSRPKPISSGQARRACREATSPLPRRPRGRRHRQRANVLMLDRKCERPFLPEHRELLRGFLGAAISLDPICRRHARSSFQVQLHKTRAAPLPGLGAMSHRRLAGSPLPPLGSRRLRLKPGPFGPGLLSNHSSLAVVASAVRRSVS